MIGALKVRFRIEGAHSLKEKRKVLKSVKDRIMRMNVSVAEVDDNDKWQAATIGIALVSNDAAFANSVMDKLVRDIQDSSEVEILDVTTEIVHI